MGILDDINAYKPTTLAGTNKHFIDGDSLDNPDGPNYRIAGYDSAEVSKLIGNRVIEGTAGGNASAEIITPLPEPTISLGSIPPKR